MPAATSDSAAMARNPDEVAPCAASMSLCQTVEAFVEFIQYLPEECLAPRQWGPREVLAHLVFWHESYAATLDAVLRKQEPPLPRGTARELNALAVSQSASEPIDHLIARFRAAQARIERLVSPADDWPVRSYTKAGSKPRSIGEFLQAVTTHLRNHQRKLRKELCHGETVFDGASKVWSDWR